MSEVGIRALKQNASAVVAAAAAGEVVTITDRGRPVAQLSAIPQRRLEALSATGRARLPRKDLAELGMPTASGRALHRELDGMRDSERY
jgi:prevent-host-death family protein